MNRVLCVKMRTVVDRTLEWDVDRELGRESRILSW